MFQYILENWHQIIIALLAVMGALAQIVALTPSKKDDEVVSKVTKVINILAGNYGNAKNETKKPE